MVRYREIDWWYWVATLMLLAPTMAGQDWALAAILSVTIWQIAHFTYRFASPVAFSVQVRVAYLALILLGCLPMMRFLHGIMIVGTLAMVMYGYCLLARTVSLFPWNRSESISWRLVRKTLFLPPMVDDVRFGLLSDAVPADGRCRMPNACHHQTAPIAKSAMAFRSQLLGI